VALVIVGFETVNGGCRGSHPAGEFPLAQTSFRPHVVDQLSHFDVDEFLFKLLLGGWIVTDCFVIEFLNRRRSEFPFP